MKYYLVTLMKVQFIDPVHISVQVKVPVLIITRDDVFSPSRICTPKWTNTSKNHTFLTQFWEYILLVLIQFAINRV